jgi:phenylpropionate dioxygenase-like ring-hydroxylating dioxygenase large terminal subunit
MDRSTQVELARRLLGRLESGELQVGDGPWRNPVAVYTDEAVLAAESEALFGRGPILAGLSPDARDPGDYFTCQVAGVPILIARGEDGALRAWLNVCRHRGGPLAEGRGRTERGFVCPYHAWRYDLAGRLAACGPPRAFEGLDRSALSLLPLPVGERHGLVYVRPAGGDGLDVDALLGGAQRELAPLGLADWHRFEQREVVRAMNWKLVVETFMEAHHLASLHRQSIAPMFHPFAAEFDAFGENGRLIAPRRSIAELADLPESEWRLLPHTTVLWFLFPNVVCIHQQDHVQLWQIEPHEHSPARSRAIVTVYTPGPVASEAAARHIRKNFDLLMDVTNDEDFELGERIQRGHAARPGGSVLFGRHELALVHYHRSLRRRLGLDPRELEAGTTAAVRTSDARPQTSR